MKQTFICAVLTVLMAVAAFSQVRMEPEPSERENQLTRAVFRAASRDSTGIALVGESAIDSTGIFYPFKYTAVQFNVSGTTPVFDLVIMAGYTAKNDTMLFAADNATMQYVPVDTLSVSAAGTYQLSITENMPVCHSWYGRLVAGSGNGNNTVIDEFYIMRDRH